MNQQGLTVPETLEKLASHGSPRQIADFLAEQGVVGTPSRSTHCVIAEYVMATVPGLTSICVTPGCDDSCCCGDHNGMIRWCPDENRWYEMSLPGSLGELAAGFDGGRYPELEDKHAL